MLMNSNNLFVNEVDKVINMCRNVNWDFSHKSYINSNEIAPFNCRKHHWYPATFVPELPFTLIEILTKPNAVIYDPFSGIGTTYFQSLILNRKPIATENCKIAINYMRSLHKLFNPNNNLYKVKEYLIKLNFNFYGDKDYTLNVPNHINVQALRPWYSARTFNQLCYLFQKEEESCDEIIKAAMRIGISSILVKASSQNRGWGYIADNVLPKQNDLKDKKALALFISTVNGLLDDIADHLKLVDSSYSQLYSEVLENDTIISGDVNECKQIKDGTIDAIITSPPYPNMADYVMSQRLSYYYMNYDIVNDLDHEIGPRKKRRNKNSLSEYLIRMKDLNRTFYSKLKNGAYLCYVMPSFGESEKERKQIIDELMQDLLDIGMIKVDEIVRLLPSKQRSHNVKWATLETEKIYIYRKV